MMKLNILSLGAGVQSTTLALMAAHGEIGPMPDCAIFADTQAEPGHVYRHLEWMRSPNVLPYPVHIVTQGNYADSERGDRSAAEHRQNGRQEPTRNGAVPDPNGERLEGQRLIACGTRAQQYDLGNPCRWLPEPDVGRVAHGVSHRMDRLRTLGNTVVPQIPELIGNAILAGMAA
jgi:hypothetical protein